MAERTRHIYAQRSFRFLVERGKTSAKRLVGETAVFSPSHDPRELPLFPLHRLPTTQNDLCGGERPHHIKQAALVTERERHVTKKKRVERTKLDFRYPIYRSAIGQASCVVWFTRAVVNWRSRSVAKSALYTRGLWPRGACREFNSPLLRASRCVRGTRHPSCRG